MRTGLTWALAAVAMLTPAAPSAAPEGQPGGRIAYVRSDGNIYVARPDGSGKRALTGDGSKALPYTQPTWSPAGTALLAVRFAGGLQAGQSASAGLYLVSAGGGSRRLTQNVPRGFAWTPDGRAIVYEDGYPPDPTYVIAVDARSGQQRKVECPGDFKLLGVTGIGNRAIGVSGGEVIAVSLSGGAVQKLTHSGSRGGVWQNLVVLTRSGRTLLYSQDPGTTIVTLDLRSGRSATLKVANPLRGLALSPDLRWIAYSYTTAVSRDTAQSALVRVGMSTSRLRGDSYITAQAFAPDSSALALTSQLDGPRTIYVVPTSCATRCGRRLDDGQDAAWGP